MVYLGLGLGEILKPEFLLPHIQELHLDQELVSYLPEVNFLLCN